MGVLGRTREVSLFSFERVGRTGSIDVLTPYQETIDVVRRAFPEIEKYGDERVEFEVGIDGSKEEWGGLMEDAWSQFSYQAPSRIKVQIKDAPGDARRSECLDTHALIVEMSLADVAGTTREVLHVLALIFGPFIGMIMFFCLVGLAFSALADDE